MAWTMISGARIYPFPTLGDDLFDDCGGSGKFFLDVQWISSQLLFHRFLILVVRQRCTMNASQHLGDRPPATVSGMPPEVLDMKMYAYEQNIAM